MQALGLVWGNLNPLTADLDEACTEIAKPKQFGANLLLEQWRIKAEHGGFIVGRDVPSRALACVLRNLALYEPIDGGTDFRVRLAGSTFIRRFGQDVTGFRLSQIYSPQNFERQCADLLAVVTGEAPHIADVTLVRDSRVYLRYESVRLPVRAPNRTSVWVLGSLFCFDWV